MEDMGRSEIDHLTFALLELRVYSLGSAYHSCADQEGGRYGTGGSKVCCCCAKRFNCSSLCCILSLRVNVLSVFR